MGEVAAQRSKAQTSPPCGKMAPPISPAGAFPPHTPTRSPTGDVTILSDSRFEISFQPLAMADTDYSDQDTRDWGGDFDPFEDPQERRVLFATFDSFR